MPASHRALASMAFATCLAGLSAPAAGQTYNIYWGDLHGHTMDSPVTLTSTVIDNYINYARTTKSLQFVALTEKDFDLSDAEWSDVRARAAALTTSSFIAFSAFEWGDDEYGDFGHRPVYWVNDSQPIFRSDASSNDHVSELLDHVLSNGNGFTSVAHPDLSNYAADWDYFDAASDRVAEIYSRHGHYEDGDRGCQQALALGHKFGFIAVSDTRTGQPGEYGLTAILSSSLTKSSLHAALKARRCYATTGARIVLRATMDSRQMGEEYISSTGPTLSVTCTPPGNDSIDEIEVLKNNVVVYTYRPSAKPTVSGPWMRVEGGKAGSWAQIAASSSSSEPTTLAGELDRARRSGSPARLRRRFAADGATPNAVLRTNLAGDYRIWLNGSLLVDTHTFRADMPHGAHDCNAPDAHALAGSPERFRQLGFYDIATLGGTLQGGENDLAIELDADAPEQPQAALEVETTIASGPVSFSWADAAFTGDAFYYLRVTQTDGEQAWGSPWWVTRQAPDTTPPLAPTKLRARKDGNDVYLDWTKVSKDIANNLEKMGYYRVFRGTTADFVPDRAGLSNQIGTTSNGRYRDSNGLPATADYYYKVAAVDAAGNESSGHSNLAFKVHHPLSFHTALSNIYWLSIPYKAVYSNADELTRDLNRASSGPVTKVTRWDITTQKPVSWVYIGGRWTGTNFSLTGGNAVAVTIKQNMDAMLVGAHEEGLTVRLTNNAGASSMNWVALPVHTPNQLAFQVVQDVNNGYFPGPATRIVRFHPDTQSTQTYQWNGSSWNGTNFVLIPGEAYGLEIQTTADWLPDTTP